MTSWQIRALCLLWIAHCFAAWPARAAESALRKKKVPAPAQVGSATPLPFSVRQDDSNWWLVSPEGRRFFSIGVCCVNQGTERTAYDPENPSYAAWQHYPAPSVWADATLRRLKSWRITTIGAWSDFETLRKSGEQTLWLAPVLHIGSTAGAPWWDMWDAKNIRRMEEVARAAILPLRDDPRLIGYYSDNELGWWNASFWKMTLEQKATSGQRRRLIQLLREIYHDDWRKLLQDFEPEGATNWRQLQGHGMLFCKSGSNGIQTMRRFLRLAADRYYQLMRDIIKKYDSRALYLGDRYQSFYYPEVARASARYVDVASSNLNASWNDGTFLRSHLDTLHALTGKPVLVSEFYMAAITNQSGNRNTQGVFPLVAHQRQRADSALNTLRALLQLPFVVGAEWFQFTDEPKHGRDDGENFNFGLVDIHNRPYDEISAAFKSLNADQLRAQPARRRSDASSGIPPAPTDPFAHFAPARALEHWDRERGFVRPVSEYPVGDLYVCWNHGALYLGLYAFDFVEAAYYRDSSVPKTDRAQCTVRIDGREIVRARIGAGREASVSDPNVRVENLSGMDLNVRNIAVMGLPVKLLCKDRLRPGDTFALDCTLLTHGQAYRVEWKGSFTLND